MSMCTLTGTLLNIFESPKGKNDKGEEYGGQDKVQLLGEVALPNGETRNELVTLTTHDRKKFEGLLHQRVRVPVGAFAAGKHVMWYIPKGATPEAVV